jgi:hypothetical protein
MYARSSNARRSTLITRSIAGLMVRVTIKPKVYPAVPPLAARIAGKARDMRARRATDSSPRRQPWVAGGRRLAAPERGERRGGRAGSSAPFPGLSRDRRSPSAGALGYYLAPYGLVRFISGAGGRSQAAGGARRPSPRHRRRPDAWCQSGSAPAPRMRPARGPAPAR